MTLRQETNRILRGLCCALFFVVFALAVQGRPKGKTSQPSLSREQVQQLKAELSSAWKAERKVRYAETMEKSTLTLDTLQMRLAGTIFGEKPEGGRSLWISLHGGGNAPKEVNDGQWLNQTMLYTPKEGLYISPRAAYDDWDMHCKPATDSLYKQLIEMAVVYFDVNPDRVYLMGYSAGGDGVWRLAPRLADHWAAASMMAGHPGDVSLVNLRNLPYMTWCGELDLAYDRNKLNVERAAELDSLQKADEGGYIHECHLMKGMGHWMEQADTLALDWMAQYTRNPYPKKVVWRQEEVVQPAFYWLSMPEAERQRGKTIRAEITGQRIDITQCDVNELTLWFCDEMLDLDKKVEVAINGKRVFCGLLPRTEQNMRRSLSERGDLSYIFPTRLTVKKKNSKWQTKQ